MRQTQRGCCVTETILCISWWTLSSSKCNES